MTRLLSFLALATLAGAAGCSRGDEGRPAQGRLGRLEGQVERQREASANAVADYAPKVPGRLDDLTAPVADLLRELPGVVQVEALVSPAKPTRRIVHLRDWHFVPEDLYTLDLRNSAGKPVPDDEAKVRYREFLVEVELVQLEQAALLKCLAHHHGLRRVHFEGLTPEEAKLYREKVAELREAGPALREQREEARRLLEGMAKAGKRKSEGTPGPSRWRSRFSPCWPSTGSTCCGWAPPGGCSRPGRSRRSCLSMRPACWTRRSRAGEARLSGQHWRLGTTPRSRRRWRAALAPCWSWGARPVSERPAAGWDRGVHPGHDRALPRVRRAGPALSGNAKDWAAVALLQGAARPLTGRCVAGSRAHLTGVESW
jgi:hypothetical protein